jgi:hypothetical protein
LYSPPPTFYANDSNQGLEGVFVDCLLVKHLRPTLQLNKILICHGGLKVLKLKGKIMKIS